MPGGGFEPGLVQFTEGAEDFWPEEDRAQVALIETFYREDVERREGVRLPFRLLRRKPERYQDPLEQDRQAQPRAGAQGGL